MSGVVAALAAAGFTSCGGSDSTADRTSGARDKVVLRVGDVAIGKPMLTHWMTVLAPQHVAPEPPHYTGCIARQRAVTGDAANEDLAQRCKQQYEALRRQVMSFFITSRWLIGEAAEEGVAVTAQEVNERLAEMRRSFASDAEYRESLDAIAHTVSDVRLEIEAELAAEKIRQRLSKGEGKVTSSEIARYYRDHIGSYHIPEIRYFDIGENFPTAAVARSKRGAVGRGEESIHESLPRKPFTDYNGEKRIIYEAIFKANPHVVSAPIRLNEIYFLINVTRITAPYVQSLAQVERSIANTLRSERHRRTLTGFVAAWRRRWIARTDCAAGYVVQKCRQYSGTREPEDPLKLE